MHRGRRRLLATVGLAAVVLLTAAVLVWRHHPPVRFEGGYSMAVERAVGETAWTPVVEAADAGTGTVHIDRVDPDVFPTGARVDYVVCDLRAGAEGGFPYGGTTADLDRVCASVRPASGAALRLGDEPGSVVLMGLTATEPGRLAVRSSDLWFSRGWQRGHSTLAVGLEVTARPAGGQTPAA